MLADDFITIAKQYNDLGWSVQEQLQSVLDGDRLEDQNINALKMIACFMHLAESYSIDFDTYEIDEYLKEAGINV